MYYRNIKIIFHCLLLLALFFPGFLFASAPETLTQTVTEDGQKITLKMTKEAVRGSNFEVMVQNNTGTYDTYTAGEVRTYIGTVDEYPGAIAAGILKDDDTLWAQVYFDRGLTWKIMGNSVYEIKGDIEPEFIYPTTDTISEGDAGKDTYIFDVGIDLDYRYYNQRTNVAECLEAAEFTISQIKAMYLRDALLQPALARIIVRASQAHCPYEGTSGTDLLSLVKTEWNTNHTDADRDIVALSTPDIGGGVAWVGVVGSNYGYSVNGCVDSNGVFDSIWKHELGHNWGALDHQAGDPEGKTIVCGNQYGRFAGPSLKKVFTERNNEIDVLDNQGAYSTINIPPYAALDTIQCTGSSVTTDPLANDHDANADDISLILYDSVSEKGGSIILSSGTGENGRDELIYSAPSGLNEEMDFFYYKIEDSGGMTATGVTMVYVQEGDPGDSNFCESASSNSDYLYINQVNIDTFSNSSDASTYSDFTSQTISMTIGDSHSITLTPGYPGASYPIGFRVWIDLNNDEDFGDSGEMVFEGSGNAAINGNITIPAGTNTGRTRMRVSMKYNSYAEPCGTFDYGEVEDYTVNISEGSDDSDITINDILGQYVRQPPTNSWHTGTISMNGDNLQWENEAGVSWPLFPDLEEEKLQTNDECPYFESSGGDAFTLELNQNDDGSIAIGGFLFLGELYIRENRAINGIRTTESEIPDIAIDIF